ncbi:succinyl-CoA ligase [ADP/GDP-forming] subunit alpha, mitochondrial [Elysia marginata]|uniref:Succinyl-CoA ligase [ADP/GDP-forming] subunit alpha, mitochondrial n=1 Tax=Elysia marginata TaxID=1093978 RepID=A0AAV4GLV0_9GAST|nr:succinyl-CoA ligase [ADP/GDP-forming] subunit alpha, mitochondrial [Elysia marginata]
MLNPQEVCKADFGGSLAELRTRQHRAIARKLVIGRPFLLSPVWLGATDQDQEGDWRWHSNNEPVKMPSGWWHDNQPDNGYGTFLRREQNCLAMSSNPLVSKIALDDEKCTKIFPSVCQKCKQKDGSSLVVQSTEPLHLILVVWRQDLTVISSSLVPPAGKFKRPMSMFGYPTSGKVSLCVATTAELAPATNVTLILSGASCDSSYSMGGTRYPNHTSAVEITPNLTSTLNNFCVDEVVGFDKAPFVHTSQPVALLTVEKQAAPTSQDETFEEILSTSQIGLDYVTIPSLPFTGTGQDTFILVAAFDKTAVEASLLCTTTCYGFEVNLDEAGDAKKIFARGFVHLTGSKLFYVYAKLGGTNSPANNSGQCMVTLLARHLWVAQYSVHMVDPWTKLQHVYIIVVAEKGDARSVRLQSLDKSLNVGPTVCHDAGR